MEKFKLLMHFLTQAKNGMVLAFKFEEQRFDCGSIDGFVKATNYFYDKETKKEELKSIWSKISEKICIILKYH